MEYWSETYSVEKTLIVNAGKSVAVTFPHHLGFIEQFYRVMQTKTETPKKQQPGTQMM